MTPAVWVRAPPQLFSEKKKDTRNYIIAIIMIISSENDNDNFNRMMATSELQSTWALKGVRCLEAPRARVDSLWVPEENCKRLILSLYTYNDLRGGRIALPQPYSLSKEYSTSVSLRVTHLIVNLVQQGWTSVSRRQLVCFPLVQGVLY